MKTLMNIHKKSFWISLFGILLFLISSPTEAATKKYTIATDTTFAPFEFQDTSGNYVGIDMDLIHSIAKEENFDIEIKALGFNAAVQALESGQVDAVIAGMSITDERKQKFDFSDSYFDSGIGLAVSTSSNIRTYEELRGKNVAVKIGTQGASFAASIKNQYGFNISTFEDSANMYQDVVSGNSVATFEDYPVLGYAIRSNHLPMTLTSYKEQVNQYGVAVLKNQNTEFIEAFNHGLATLKANGEYDKILNKYIGTDEETSKSTEDTSLFGLLKSNASTLLNGLWNTIWITFVSLFIATIIGVLLGLMRTSRMTILETIATIYVDFMRGIPLIVLTFFIYFGIPQAFNIRLDATVAAISTLGLNAAAYIAEIVRGGINAIDKGQSEAAMSLGLPYYKSMQKIILPQAIRIMVPSFINQFVITLKDTSILSIIGLVELTQTGKIIIARNLQSSSMWFIVGMMYLIVITLLTKISARLERKA